jgi:MFS family permease
MSDAPGSGCRAPRRHDGGARAGLRPWLMWALGAALFLYASFQRVAPSVMVNDLMADFAVTAAALGSLSAFFYWAYAAVQIPVGVLVDRWGPRRVLAGAAFLGGVGTLMFASAETLTTAYAGRLLLGLGTGVALVSTLKLAVVWLPSNRYALITGLTIMMSGAGSVVAQAPLAATIAATGWRTAMAATGVGALVVAVLCWLVIRDTPEADGRDGRSAAGASAGISLLRGLRTVAANRESWYAGACMAMLTIPMISFAALWGVPYLIQAYGIDRPTAAAVTSVAFVAWALGALAGGWLSDRIGRRKPILISIAGVSLVTWTTLLYAPGLPLAWVVVLMASAGLAGSTMGPIFAVGREHNPPEAAGAAAGFINAWPIFGGAAAQSVTGWLLDLGWDGRTADGVRIYAPETYVDAFVICPLAAAAGLVFASLQKETHGRQQPA